jgi:uncharacterized membrane protein YdfJ with MMPL/SSD domain
MPTYASTDVRRFRHVLLAFVLLAAVLVAVAGRTAELRTAAAPPSAPTATAVSHQGGPVQQVPLR